MKKEVIQQESSTDYTSERDILFFNLRSLADWELTNILLVSDIDGNLHGVERNSGAVVWTLPLDEPLVQVSKNENSKAQNSAENNLLWLVEPFNDGSLYYFTPQFGLNKLPTSIKNLVMESPFSLKGDSKIYTGIRKTSLHTINVHTGEIINCFGSVEDSCPAPNLYRSSSFSKDSSEGSIMIGKTTYELLIHYKDDPSVIWNITYSSWGPNNIDNDLILQNTEAADNLYFTPFHDRSLLAINRNAAAPQWISKLPSLAVNVFDIFNDRKHRDQFVMLPHPLKVLNEIQTSLSSEYDSERSGDLCFVNKTGSGKEWFVMSMLNYPTLLKSAPMSHYQLGVIEDANGILDPKMKSFFRKLDVHRKDGEQAINGVHRSHNLIPNEMYQPILRFTDRNRVLKIGDGVRSDNLPSTQTKPPKLPSMIDGMHFLPNDRGKELATIIERGKESIAHDRNTIQQLPMPVQKESNSSMESRKTISVFKRIAEDLLVSAVLLVFFIGFGKLSGYITIFNSTDQTSNNNHTEEKPLADISLEPVPAIKANDEQFTKKVSILAPHDDKPTFTLDETEGQDSQRSSLDIQPEAEDETETGESVIATKKKRKRGSRGGKRGGKGKKLLSIDDGDSNDVQSAGEETVSTTNEKGQVISTTSLVKTFKKPPSPPKRLQIDNNLVISDKILGYGSHGTVVFEGSFENRPVAVKRMLLDFYDVANHEVRLLQESDDHPNVIRYFCSQSSESEKFLYIALERCECSLEDLIEKRMQMPSIKMNGIKSEVLFQLVSGLHYLHSLKIVHRDLKPQNILVGDSSSRKRGETSQLAFRLLISDFGLCKKLDGDQSSFRATTQNAASGTSGWRAPELLLHHDLSEISPDIVSSVHSGNRSKDETNTNTSGKRLTKTIDIFSLGCVFFYILTSGLHPFGDRYLREGNIIKGEYDLSPLKEHCPEDWVEASDLLGSMIAFNTKDRPDTGMLMKHPYFWNMNKKLEFLIKVSDRFEIEMRDPPSPLLVALENTGDSIHQGDWHSKFDQDFMDNLGKYRKYHLNKVMDLLRALRNKYHHFNDMPKDLQNQMSPLPHGFYKYFNDKFPKLLMEIYCVVKENIRDEHVFEEFF